MANGVSASIRLTDGGNLDTAGNVTLSGLIGNIQIAAGTLTDAAFAATPRATIAFASAASAELVLPVGGIGTAVVVAGGGQDTVMPAGWPARCSAAAGG